MNPSMAIRAAYAVSGPASDEDIAPGSLLVTLLKNEITASGSWLVVFAENEMPRCWCAF
ncbi:hypothetical protein FHR47_000452 [Xanthomonas arboricola]|uniref:hypothetical protein n=1 Tax=Xanthomonas cannabis TaxID=1885674 RepID=UPI00160CF415|nr:hypothetical protein [Xanthomonas cannabis]MBB3800227.1 hypothetical protein [Xanthomonas cannabis]